MDVDVGNLKNHMGILAVGFEKVSTQKIIELVSGFVTISDLSGMLKINFVADFIPVEKCLREKLLALVCVTDMLYELFDKNVAKVRDWLMVPNPLFFDFSPFHMVLGGKADVVIGKLNDWLFGFNSEV
jgi:hypothetical protein